MSGETLSAVEGARLALAAQHLLEPAPPGPVAGLAGHLAGIQAQLMTSPGLAAFHRLRGYVPGSLERELEPGGSLARVWCMRGTLHVVPSFEAGLFLCATAPAWFERWGRHMERLQDTFQDREPLRRVVLAALEEGPRDRVQLATALEALGRRVPLYAILKELNYLGLVVPVGAGLRPRYDLATRVLPHAGPVARKPGDPGARAARDELLRRYFRAYGPATLADFAWWSGLTVAEARDSLDRAGEGLQAVRLAGQRAPAYLYPRTAPAGELPTALLGPFEPLILGYRDRSRFLDPANRKLVVGPTGMVAAVVLHRGRIVATWKTCRRSDGLEVTVTPFAHPDGGARATTASAARRLQDYYGIPLREVRWV
ncbi:MAG: winged helix DNA-binding domain-containing protein [bacterium]|nr:winged helix DNA-binding domain-containing protein [bacterium]